MRNEKQIGFARLEGAMMKHGIPEASSARLSLKELQAEAGSMSALQIALVEKLVEGVIEARNHVNKEKFIGVVTALEL